MCVCDWQLLAVTVVLTLLIVGYGEFERRRRGHARQLATQRYSAAHCPPENRAACISPPDASTEPFRSHSGEIT